MKMKNILMLAAGIAAVAAVPAVLAQASKQQPVPTGAAAQQAEEGKAQSEADRKAQRRAEAAAAKAKAEKQGKLNKGAEEEEELPPR